MAWMNFPVHSIINNFLKLDSFKTPQSSRWRPIYFNKVVHIAHTPNTFLNSKVLFGQSEQLNDERPQLKNLQTKDLLWISFQVTVVRPFSEGFILVLLQEQKLVLLVSFRPKGFFLCCSAFSVQIVKLVALRLPVPARTSAHCAKLLHERAQQVLVGSQ